MAFDCLYGHRSGIGLPQILDAFFRATVIAFSGGVDRLPGAVACCQQCPLVRAVISGGNRMTSHKNHAGRRAQTARKMAIGNGKILISVQTSRTQGRPKG